MPSFRELLAATKAEIREVDTVEADAARHEPGTVILDVREPEEHQQGAIPGALHIGVDITVDGTRERKSLVGGTHLARTPASRDRSGFITELLNPSESSLPASGPVRRIDIGYPHRELHIGFSKVPWPLAAVMLMMVLGLVVGRLLGVRIA